MDAAGVAHNPRDTLDRATNARPTSAHTHSCFQSLTAAQNIEGTEALRKTEGFYFTRVCSMSSLVAMHFRWQVSPGDHGQAMFVCTQAEAGKQRHLVSS